MNPGDVLLALLFAAPAPLTERELAEAAEMEAAAVRQTLEALEERLATGPLHLVRLAGGVQLATRPEYAPYLGRLLRRERGRLSRALMEVLAIVAYRQPVTLGEIETVRGVGSDHGVRGLLERRLIREAGRRAAPGRPIEYRTTDEFLHQFHLADLAALPPLPEEDEGYN